jgi:hypothetical protein
MKTIKPLEFEALLEASQPVEIIDIRPRDEFEKLHIEGAHSLPLPELAPETLKSLRELPSAEPFYLISASEGVRARWPASRTASQHRGLASRPSDTLGGDGFRTRVALINLTLEAHSRILEFLKVGT